MIQKIAEILIVYEEYKYYKKTYNKYKLSIIYLHLNT